VQFYCPHAPADGNQCIQIREKMLEFSSTMLPTLPPYLQRNENEHIKKKKLLLRTFNSPFSGTTQVSQYQKGKTNLDFSEARDSE